MRQMRVQADRAWAWPGLSTSSGLGAWASLHSGGDRAVADLAHVTGVQCLTPQSKVVTVLSQASASPTERLLSLP